MRYFRKDLRALNETSAINLESAFESLKVLYDEVDRRNERNTRDLNLPCSQGCSSCCEESVFLTPLEFLYAWDFLQKNVEDSQLDDIIDKGLALYQEHRDLIDAFEKPPPHGEKDHVSIHLQLRFRCPLLSAQGTCRVYPAREILGRLFGSSFNSEGGVYGCHLVGAHLGGQNVTLIRARPMAQRIHNLPLSDKQQVYPFYIHQLYGKTRVRLPIALE